LTEDPIQRIGESHRENGSKQIHVQL